MKMEEFPSGLRRVPNLTVPWMCCPTLRWNTLEKIIEKITNSRSSNLEYDEQGVRGNW